MKDWYIFTRRDIRHVKIINGHFAWCNKIPHPVETMPTQEQKINPQIRIKWCNKKGQQNVLVVGEKRFPTLRKFLSTHMTCTCGYTLQGCIHFNVYSHAPAH